MAGTSAEEERVDCRGSMARRPDAIAVHYFDFGIALRPIDLALPVAIVISMIDATRPPILDVRRPPIPGNS